MPKSPINFLYSSSWPLITSRVSQSGTNLVIVSSKPRVTYSCFEKKMPKLDYRIRKQLAAYNGSSINYPDI